MEPRLKKRLLSIVFIIGFIGLHIWMLQYTFSHSINGTHVYQNKDGQWVVKSFELTSAKYVPELRVGDIVLEVNGVHPSEFDSVIKWRSLDTASTLKVERDGEIFETKAYSPVSTTYDILPFLGGIVGYFIAGILYQKMKRSPSAQYLANLFFSIGLTFSSLGGSIRGDSLSKIIVFLGVILVPSLFMHFIIALAREKGGIILPFRFLKCQYLVMVVITVFFPFFLFSKTFTYPIYAFARLLVMLFFIAVLVIDLILMAYLTVKERRNKTFLATILRTAWVSLFVSMTPLVAGAFIPLIFIGRELVDSLYLAWPILLFPLTFAYLLLSNRIYDIGMIMRRMLVTALFALVPSAVIILFSHIIPETYIGLFSILVFAVLTYSFYSVENIFTRLEKVFFPRKHYLQSSIKSIAKKLESITNLRDLKDLILTDIVNTLEIYGGAIVLVHQQSVETFAAGDIDVVEAERLVLSVQTEHEEYSLFPIAHNEEYSSYLVVTRKRTNTLLSLEEKRWLAAIISYLAVSLENLHLIRKLTVNLQQLAAHVPNEEESRELNWFRKVTFELQESERKRIASDLHDTTMQDLFFLKRKLRELFDELELEGLHSRKAEHLLEHIDIINATLRESFFELHPHLLQEIGLVKTIGKVIDKEKYGCPFEINYHVFGREEIEKFDLETKRHIFRIVQELFNNAKKHSQARHVSLSLVVDDGTFRLDYRDDGIGFEPRRRAAQEIGASGMGMEYMKSRALYLGGTFALDTAPGKGMKLTITLPADKPHLRLVYDKDHA